MNKAAERGGLLALAALIIANIALACGPWLVRLADTGPVSAGFWRLALAMPFLFLLAARARQPVRGYAPRIWWLLAIGGVAFAIDLASWHIGIEKTRLANATLFGNAGSLIMVVYGFFLTRSLPRRLEWLALSLAAIGTALLMGRSLELSWDNLIGDIFCLAAGLFYAVYLIALRGGRDTLGSWAVLAHSTLFGVLPILIFAIFMGEPVWPQNWTPVVVLAFSSQLIGQGLMVYALRHFSPIVIGLALLGQPAIAASIGYFAFGETLLLADLLGMAAICAALVLVRLPEARRLRKKRGAPVSLGPSGQ